MIEFRTNNNKLALTKLYPLFSTKDLHPYMSFDIVDLSNSNTCEQIFK